MKTHNDNFPDVIGIPTALEKKALEDAHLVKHLVFPDFHKDPTGWRIVRQLHLNPFIGMTWMGENIGHMTEDEKVDALAAIKKARDLFRAVWKRVNKDEG